MKDREETEAINVLNRLSLLRKFAAIRKLLTAGKTTLFKIE